VTVLDTKNGEDRTVRLCNRAVATLRDIGPKESGPVFTCGGNPIKDVKSAFRSACMRAGIEGLRFHDLRCHTFASRLVQGGAKGSGAPSGPANGNYRTGFWTAQAIADRRYVQQLIREAKELLEALD